MDIEGSFWIFGGLVNIGDPYNDLWKCHPNPATHSCTISVSDYGGENITARLNDITGQESDNWSFATSSYTIPLSNYASGIYLLQITSGIGGQTVKKLVVE